jgi:hypothetical protein
MKSQRPPIPEFLKQWRDWIKAGPPRCCHTCEHYKNDGRCAVFDMVPPAEFAATVDRCQQWEQEIPW